MENIKVHTLAEMNARGEKPEVLFWVGCAGSFDDRAKKITKALVKILTKANVSYAVLGTEESCTGDPAKRAGNEFLFQINLLGFSFVPSKINDSSCHETVFIFFQYFFRILTFKVILFSVLKNFTSKR